VEIIAQDSGVRQMPVNPPSSHLSDQTLVRARELRERYARAAALYAYRIERARASARTDAVAHWTAEYRRSSARCRLLGEIVRGEREAA
jgi:hypothetical protein